MNKKNCLEDRESKRKLEIEERKFRANLELQVCINLCKLPLRVIKEIFEYLPLDILVVLMTINEQFSYIIVDSNMWHFKTCKFIAERDEKDIQEFFENAHLYLERLSITGKWITEIQKNLILFPCKRLKYLSIETTSNIFFSRDSFASLRNIRYLETPINLHTFQYLCNFNNLEELVLRTSGDYNSAKCLQLMLLPILPSLKRFTLMEKVLERDLITFLQQRFQLTHLKISMNILNEHATKWISNMIHLKELRIHIDKNNDSWPSHLSSLNHLEHFVITFNGDPIHLFNFFRDAKCINLKHLHLRLIKSFELNFVTSIVGKFPLESLTLEDIKKFEDNALDLLPECKTLTHLSFIICDQLNNSNLVFLPKMKKQLIHLDLHGCQNLNDKCLRFILSCKRLRYLNVSSTMITRTIAQHLGPIKRIRLRTFVCSFLLQEVEEKCLKRIPIVKKIRNA